ncbi:EamA family transporter [Nakamurella sp. YIM 132087]|uniref:EamA family transporter n=1 Tax=Nakamurella alba TaxID=2665158 RepID=A0A7K1FHZ8_9ACTN|nr:EamA family transporter [Nakamurella alba]MTD12504.1 EamA family transporter [Nakamurella alba]
MRAGPGQIGVALGLVYVIWGSVYLAVRLVIDETPPLTAMGARFLIAAVLLGGYVWWRRGFRSFRLSGRQIAGVILMGLCLLAIGNGLTSLGQQHGVSSGGAALLVASAPLWIALLRTASGDRPPWLGLLGVLVGFGGLVVLVLGGGAGVGPLPALGVGVMLVSAFCWSLGSWIRPRVPLPADPLVGATYQLAVAGVTLATAGLVSGEPFDPHLSVRGWGAMAYLVVVVSIVGFSAYTWLLQHAPVSVVSTHAYVNPVVAVLLGAVVLHEPVTAAVLVGGGVVVLAVVLVIGAEQRARRRNRSPVGRNGGDVTPVDDRPLGPAGRAAAGGVQPVAER